MVSLVTHLLSHTITGPLIHDGIVCGITHIVMAAHRLTPSQAVSYMAVQSCAITHIVTAAHRLTESEALQHCDMVSYRHTLCHGLYLGHRQY